MNRYTIPTICITVLLLLSPSVVVSAQVEVFDGGSSVDRIKIAKAYISQGNYERALEFLLRIDRETPNQPVVLELLFDVYKNLKEYDKAEDVLKRRRTKYGDSPQLKLLFGDLYLRTGDIDAAREVIQSALSENPRNIALYPKASNVYRSNGFYDDAQNMYLQAREITGDKSLYAMQLGQLYEIRRDYESALYEYYSFMTADTLNQTTGNIRITRLIEYADDDESIVAIKRALAKLGNDNPNDFLIRKYHADILMGQDSLRSAMILYKEVETIAKSYGREMIYFARRCLDHNAPSIAAEAAQYVLDKYPNHSYFLQAKYLLATSFVQLEKPDSAIALLHEIFEIGGQSREFLEAYISIGNIYLDHKHEPDSALVYFNKVLERTGKGQLYFRTMIRIGDAHLVAGELEVADSIFNTIELKALHDSDREHLLWRWAQTKFYMHEFEDAKRLYGMLSGMFYKSLYVNDCLRKMLMIDENSGMDVIPLKSYADAEYYELRGMNDSAEVILTKLAGRTGSGLGAYAALKLGELYLDIDEYQSALDAFRNLLDNFEDSFYRGEALKQLADTYLLTGDRENASLAYRELLTEYENVSLKEHARERLKELENL